MSGSAVLSRACAPRSAATFVDERFNLPSWMRMATAAPAILGGPSAIMYDGYLLQCRRGSDMSKNSSAEPPNTAMLANPLEDLLGYQLRRASQAMLDDLVATLESLDFRSTSAS